MLTGFIISLYLSLSQLILGGLFLQHPPMLAKGKYDFIRYDLNHLYQSDSTSLASFQNALQQRWQGKQPLLNIVHIGDSHIQADFFTAVVREKFQSIPQWGNAGRGFFFPCEIAGSSAVYNISAQTTGYWQGCHILQASKNCNWGLSGFTASTQQENAQLSVWSNVYALRPHKTQWLRIYFDNAQELPQTPVKIQQQGAWLPPDSQNPLYAAFRLTEPAAKIQLSISPQQCPNKQFSLEGVYSQEQETGVLYHALGVNGATVNAFLRSPKLGTQLATLSPDLIVVSLGTNDVYTDTFDPVAFENQLYALVQTLKSAAPKASILLTTPGDHYYKGKSNAHLLAANEVIYAVAKAENCAVWDFFAVMGGVNAIPKWLQAQLASRDYLHLSRKGYELQGELFYQALTQPFFDNPANSR
ncbi:MAG TPA: hypothetical protein DCM08_05260 [Microscillaceae bacterium]|jgi:lysophospholipase L1-like esterase|nr:hypothetical protein [Microscillaceae bacterium]